ncbi:MAG: FAD-dependent oxidoreductase [Limnochordia bacterium]|jgi:hypothetical protein
MQLVEPARTLNVAGDFDLIVCGAGPAGVAAAVTAGRSGLRVLLVESQGCLGGIWTSGLLCLVLDGTGKCGLVEEIGERLEAAGARRPRSQRADFLYDPETMKVLLEDLCNEAGVHMRLHTRVVAAIREDGLLRAIVTESPSGREAFTAPLFVDSTGNGDLAAYAQCAYDHGHPVSGKTQPATLFAIISGVPKEISGTRAEGDKERFRAMLNSVGIDPSYQSPSLFPLPHPELHCLMINHEYDVRCDSADEITQATVRARKELYLTVQALRKLPAWDDARLVATAAHIGLREGRRVRGLYHVTADDVVAGRRFGDGVCLVRFGVDVHALERSAVTGYANHGLRSKPYHIPYRALVARDLSNLALAGRCISGDFFAHASYRVTGNAVPMGEAVGLAASMARATTVGFHAVDGETVSKEMRARGYEL